MKKKLKSLIAVNILLFYYLKKQVNKGVDVLKTPSLSFIMLVSFELFYLIEQWIIFLNYFFQIKSYWSKNQNISFVYK